jgi:hypothetical protein
MDRATAKFRDFPRIGSRSVQLPHITRGGEYALYAGPVRACGAALTGLAE